LIVYFLVFGFLILSTIFMIPPFIEQTTSFANSLPTYISEFRIPGYVADEVARQISVMLGGLPSQIVKISVSIFSNVMAVVTVFILALYFLLARERLDEQMAFFMGDGVIKKDIHRIINKLENKLGGWARGEIVLMLVVGFATYLGLTVIGVPFAIPLAILAGILEIIPNIGPTLAAIPAVIVGFGVSSLTGFAALALSVLIQQTENYVLVPKVMEKSVGISPIVTLVSLIIGFRVAGIVGAILSVPIAITMQVLMSEFLFQDKKTS